MKHPRLRSSGLLDLRSDAMAGLTTAVMLIPQAMAKVILAGLPPIVGPYAAALIIGASQLKTMLGIEIPRTALGAMIIMAVRSTRPIRPAISLCRALQSSLDTGWMRRKECGGKANAHAGIVKRAGHSRRMAKVNSISFGPRAANPCRRSGCRSSWHRQGPAGYCCNH